MMQTLIHPEAKLKEATILKANYEVKNKSNNIKARIDLELYQKLFVIFLTSCVFLIFPESPYEAESLCQKQHSKEACIVW